MINEKTNIHENFPLKEGNIYYGFKFIRYIYSDKHNNHLCEFECPRCGKTFITQLNNIQSGHTKSCGCLRTEKKKNRVYFVDDSDNKKYVKVFFFNYDGYFIVDFEDYFLIKNFCWSADKILNKKGEITRIISKATINKKIVSLSKFLMNPPNGMEVDHINGETNDFRRINLRICTKKQNLYNREIGQGSVYQKENGKYGIRNFSPVDTVDLEFDTFGESNDVLFHLQDEYMGNFAYRNSQKYAKENDSFEFAIKAIYGGTLQRIFELPQTHVANITLRNILRREKKGICSEGQSYFSLFDLIKKYKQGYFE